MTKQEYIGTYVGKKMKRNKLPYGLEYLNLVGKYESIAEKYWERMINNTIKKHNYESK